MPVYPGARLSPFPFLPLKVGVRGQRRQAVATGEVDHAEIVVVDTVAAVQRRDGEGKPASRGRRSSRGNREVRGRSGAVRYTRRNWRRK